MRDAHPLVLDVAPQELALADDFCVRFRARKSKPIRPGAVEVECDWQLAGKVAEIVIGRELCLPVNLDVFEGADAADFVLRDGRTLAVKAVQVHTNIHYDFKLIVRPHEVHSDLLALALLAPNKKQLCLPGYCEARAYFEHASIERGWAEHGPVAPLTLTRQALTPFYKLLPRPTEAQGKLW